MPSFQRVVHWFGCSLLGLLLLVVSAFGLLMSLMGSEAATTGANPGAWWVMLLCFVIAPFGGAILCFVRLFSPPDAPKTMGDAELSKTPSGRTGRMIDVMIRLGSGICILGVVIGVYGSVLGIRIGGMAPSMAGSAPVLMGAFMMAIGFAARLRARRAKKSRLSRYD